MKLNQQIHHAEAIARLVGVQDRNLLVFKQYLGIVVSVNGSEIITDAKKEQIPLLEAIFAVLIELAEHQVQLSERDVMYIIKLAEKDELEGVFELYKNRKRILINDQGRSIYPKTFNQKTYVDAITHYDLVFGVGPAGTGKTYLAVAQAVADLKNNIVKKLVLTRPVVEAGENLGFLPGDLKEKVDPYLVPLYDALYEMLGTQTTLSLMEKGVIEIAPLAYMRGRTLENAFVILDEAQNTTKVQMKMFLTRLGFASKMVITGDPTQSDLPRGIPSGLNQALQLLDHLDDIKIVTFDKLDVVRHPLVQRILERYESNEN
ncbi:MAG: phosphate starvation-inducible protein PhoH [Tenericutes bacterium GWC2_34_14]|nr:MAG: phosphate starvation-inducible protein PhoH [Tenericutes bacterium GWA2_35_7]OHE28396.1 MAG: phosphate starvation-inducible protein PhoH [Tenericutes bacterium GWC2_34_14]OHE33696.1 MAG: phosphate starvation-inducible protein PhoH [Tenericutes bacterium GWE2_34_108]OHE36981.1 MAG: phosphate starvation-inducible protein PhoH [Tenericutes bacterium GWF1_35_14]OHE37939.1 MAG: phosphate starvation-inducible protein PhoH [Tenericutes bacterium GWF2_35_184]OHE41116.1 MAG: phosphate starvatio